MDKLVIHGQRPLKGRVQINGAKNAAIYATQILGAGDDEYRNKIVQFKQDMAQD